MNTIIVWFRQDLRVQDNPALRHALAEADRVIPLYIHAPEEMERWRPGAASNWWLHQNLSALARELERLGSGLILRRGNSLDILLEILDQTDARAVYCNRIYEPANLQRNRHIKEQLSRKSCDLVTHRGNLLREPETARTQNGQTYRVFTPFYKFYLREGIVAAPLPRPRSMPPLANGLVSEPLDALRLLPRSHWSQGLETSWPAGEAAARQQLDKVVKNRLEGYPVMRDLPGEQGTSRLSPYLALGVISVHTIAEKLSSLQHQGDGATARSKGAEAMLRQLVWRDFAHYVLFHYPHTSDEPFAPRFRNFPWKRSDRNFLHAWKTGTTGLPIVDAGMRELWHTGWMHNRVRMIAASLLTKNAGIHWLTGAKWFWDTLVDADLAQNSMNWQWVAGCGVDAAPYFRIFNPLTQSKKFDPSGAYIRKWIPELASIPETHIHEPSAMTLAAQKKYGCIIGRDYPAPILDLKETRSQALQRYQEVR